MIYPAKILHLIATGFYGGPEKQILHHVRMLRASGIDARIGSFEENGRPELLQIAEQCGIPTHFLARSNPLRQSRALATILRDQKIDVLCTHSYKANVAGYLASKRTSIPQIAFVRGWIAETPKVRFYEILDRWVLARTEHVVCVARPQAERLMRRGGKGRKLLPPAVVPNAVLPEPHHAVDLQSVHDSLKTFVPPGAFLLGVVGRLSQEKGHADLLDAMSWLIRHAPETDFHLAILGEGRELESLRKRAMRLSIVQHTHFFGFRRDIGAWLEHIDCLVQPSHTEGTPNSVLEAMLAKTPVIATAVGGVPDLIEDGRSGLLVPPHAPVVLAHAIQRLASSAALRQQLSTGATMRLQQFSLEVHFERMMAVYRTALQLQMDPSEVSA